MSDEKQIVKKQIEEQMQVKSEVKQREEMQVQENEKKKQLGRPNDKQIQKILWKKIGGHKVQILAAQTKMQICLVQKFIHKNQIKKNKNKNNKKIQKLSIQDCINKIFININFDIQQRKKLFHRFDQIKNQWEYKQFQSNQQLPDYMYDDQYDLSYTLHQLHQAKDIDLGQVNSKDLLFLLFCKIASKYHNHLDFGYIDYYHLKWDFMVNILQNQLNKLKEKMIKKKKQESEEQKVNQDKTKKIKKENRERNKNKKKRNQQKEKQKQKQLEKTLFCKENDNELAYKACVYIYWAYRYAIKRIKLQ